MSFFTFNQLYGQWHVMSRASSCSNDKEKVRAYKSEENQVKVDEGTKDTVIPKAKVEIQIKNKASAVSDVPSSVKTESETPTLTQTQPQTQPQTAEKSIYPKDQVEQTLVEVEKESGHDLQNSVPDTDQVVTDYETEENLEEIEYLHLPSQDLAKLKERIKHSSHAKRKFRLWKETMGMCVYCGKHIAALDFVTGVQSDIEHIIPQAIGGTSAFDNLVCSCRKCNRAKGDRTAMDYVLTLNSRKQAEYFNLLRLLVSSGSMSEEKYFNLLRPVRLVKL